MTGTPLVSSTSSVLGISRIALAPAQTTATGRAAQLFEIGRNIEGQFRAAMHAADAAGGEQPDARHVGRLHRGGDGRARRCAAW